MPFPGMPYTGSPVFANVRLATYPVVVSDGEGTPYGVMWTGHPPTTAAPRRRPSGVPTRKSESRTAA
jgi:hypothetical protein